MGASPTALMAQTMDNEAAAQDEGEEIIVTGQPQRGAVVGNVKPEQQLSAADVRALGVTSISEMITELSAQTNGPPVVLLNGKRISSFSEIQDIPSEAVARVDILPEEVALSYGYAPTQKVVNIVLRQRFRAELADLRGGTTTDGGRENGSAEAGLLRIRGDDRFTLNLKYSNAASLLERERNIDRPASGPALIDLTRFRTLSPATESVSANATYARALGNVSMTVNGRVELSDNDTLQGLSAAALAAPQGDGPLYRDFLRDSALDQQIRGTTGHVGLTFNGLLGKGWQWSFTGNGDVSDTRTRTERSESTDRASARSQAVTGDLLLSGPLFDLPAGTVTSSVRVGASANGFEGRSIRNGVERDNDYDRQIASGQISLDLPITSKSRGVLGTVGDIGVNLNAATQKLSDFGTLSTLGYGLRWRPVPAVQLLVSANQDRAAPTGNQITDPEVRTENIPVFDYRTGETVFVTRVTGGNALLRESVRDQFRLSATVKPFEKPNLTLTATYLNSRTANPIAAFPEPTPAIEAAFADRFIRDADQRLTEIRAFPVNYLRSQSEQLRWGFDLSFPLKSRVQKLAEAWRAAGAKPEDRPKELQAMRGLFGNRGGRGGRGGSRGEGPGGPEGASPPQGHVSGDQPRSEGGMGRPRGGGRPGGGFGGGHGGGNGRLSFSLYHTWHFTESILIAPGVPELDLLNGDATGSSGGQPRHEIKARIGYTNNGLGARLNVDWESGTHVDGALGGASRLNFGSLATANLRLFANLGQMPLLVKQHPFLRGTRVSIGIDNIFNKRREVTDATGATPLRYQQGYLDPLGRTISISFRKLFF
ncbi:TonB-dependent receptor-like protein precursor [Sphingobium herbicidovorans NBRC 16415]|uniref:TonB-dependent receptor-like protein n=2 Tax=Sphingobium herbicidovorans TaxID=76947 RepID=A0A086PAK1_SPHHM|nr:TonB-dependent receptor-like protein precursor [Sphingobium herbicidovorans NBRC 16415]